MFTNEDLKRLKESLSTYEDEQQQSYRVKEFKALLARLECAERKIRAHELHHDADNDGGCFANCPSCKEIVEADRAWRKSKGEKS